MADTRWVPFTVHIRIVPRRPGKRWEYIRSLQKLSVLIYNSFSALGGFQFAQPGGGQAQQFGEINHRGGYGDYSDGMAIKFQIGQSPSQLMITGFYNSTAPNLQAYADHQLISGGRVAGGTTWSGPGPHSNDATPVATIDSEVKTVKAALKAAITSAIPSGITWTIFRIDYNGVIYGIGGFHFPM